MTGPDPVRPLMPRPGEAPGPQGPVRDPSEGGQDDAAVEREMEAIRAALTQGQRRMILAYALRTMPAHVRWWALLKAWVLGC